MSVSLVIPPIWPPPYNPKVNYINFKPSTQNPSEVFVKGEVCFDNLENGQHLPILQHMLQFPQCCLHHTSYVEQPDSRFTLIIEYSTSYLFPAGSPSLLTYNSWDTVNFIYPQ